MVGAVLTTMVQAGALLTLDARDRAVTCPLQPADEVVVCARRDVPTTRLPMRLNGTRGVLLVEPSGPARPLCNPDFVARAGIAATRRVTLGSIGPVDAKGAEADPVVLDAAGTDVSTTVQWADGRSVRDADCVAGPGALRQRAIRFLLGPARAGATASVLPFDRSRRDRPYARIPIDRRDIAARFEIDHAVSVLTAPAARIVAASIGGTVTGPARREPIMYGIERSIRRLETPIPMRLGHVPIDALWVRVADYGEADKLHSLSPDEAAEGDIVAAARHDPPGQVRLLRVGRDAVSTCVSLTVDMRRREFTLIC